MLVGRDSELARLRGMVEHVAAGQGAAVLVEGEPGVGKSALLAAGLAEAPRLGCRLLWSRGDELNQRFLLRPLLDSLDAGGVIGDPRRLEIDRMLRGQAAGLGLGSGADPVAAACEQLLALVDELCATGPVVLVVDDLYWADEPTVQVWHRLARSVNQLPLMLAAAVRPVPARNDLAVLRRSLQQQGGELIELGPLPGPAVTELVTHLAGAPPGPNLARLATGAAGNSLYLIELLAALQRDGALQVSNGVAEAPPDTVTASLGSAIAGRLAFLSAPTRDVLRAACLLGTGFTATDLATVLRRPASDIARPLQEATAAGVLADTGPTLTFRHALIWEALYNDTPASLRAALHRDAAHALADSSAPVERVAAQLMRAGDTVDAWALDWLVTAAKGLTSQAPGVAAELLRVTIDGLAAGDPRRNTLAAQLATALFRAGRSKEAEHVARAALDTATDPDLVSELYWFFCESGRFDDALSQINQALATPGLRAAHAARLQAMAAQCYGNQGDIEAAERTAETALAAARTANERWAMGYALNIAAVAQAWRGRLQAALPLREQGLAAAGDDPELAHLRTLLQTNHADTLIDLDRFEEARPVLREVSRLAEQTGNLRRLTMARAILVRCEYETGRWDDALVEAESPAEFTDASSASYVHGLAALIALHRDDEITARRHITLGTPATTMVGGWHDSVLHARALEQERAGRPYEALGTLTAYLTGEQRTAADWVTHLSGVDAVRLAVAVADLATARDLTARIEEFAAKATTPGGRAAVGFCRGLITADPALLAGAAAMYRDVGRLLPFAQATEAAADLHAQAGDKSAARELFTELIAAYTQLGAVWDIARADARFRALGVRRGRRSIGARPHSGPGSLTPTEATIARLVAEGLSNPQIGDRMFLSRRTVQTHVSHILTKLEMNSRVEIARQFS